jgi:predicted ATPase
MTRPYIEKLRIQDYGCIRDATIQLTRLHALIGPNDSGKSTVLRALRTLPIFAEGLRGGAREWERVLDELQYRERKREPMFKVSRGAAWWEVSLSNAKFTESWAEGSSEIRDISQPSKLLQEPALKDVALALRGATLLRADPDEMRLPSGLILDGQPLRFTSERGAGLPGVYDAIVNRDLAAYVEINSTVKRLFPPVATLSTKNPAMGTKTIGVQLMDGTFVPAEHMSEGLLYFLAFAALPYLEPRSLLLIEEPENGLHPARIREVMKILREVSKTTQVVLATHSPLVINELEGEEVTLLTRTIEKGTTATRLVDTPNFAERKKVFALGELWVSYADGEQEAPLFKEPEPVPESGEPVDWLDEEESERRIGATTASGGRGTQRAGQQKGATPRKRRSGSAPGKGPAGRV